jgi:hypothetical protein
MLERGQGSAQGILGPALRIGFDRIVLVRAEHEAVKSGDQFGSELGQLELPDQICRFGDNEVVAMGEGFA